MSKSFVKPPVEDKIINDDGYLSQVWREWFIDTWQTLDGLANEAGIQFPNLTQAQRTGASAIINTANIDAGFTVYQTDGTAGFYYWDGSSWQTLP